MPELNVNRPGLPLYLPRQVYVNGFLVYEGFNVPFMKLAVQYQAHVRGSDIRDGFIIYHMKSPFTPEEIKAMTGVV